LVFSPDWSGEKKGLETYLLAFFSFQHVSLLTSAFDAGKDPRECERMRGLEKRLDGSGWGNWRERAGDVLEMWGMGRAEGDDE